MDLKVIKFVSGESVVATVEPITDAPEPMIRLCNPAMLRPTSTPQGVGVGLGEWPQFSDSSAVDVRVAHIIAVADVTAPNMLNAYNTMFGGITTAEKPGLLLPA